MPFLRVIQGGRSGELHELAGDRLVLGRHPSCEVVLDNPVISRQHARLIRQGTGYVIEDLGSRNGTYVNGKSVAGLQTVHDADRIRICDYVLEFLDELPLIDETLAEDRLFSASPAQRKQVRAGDSPRTIENETFQYDDEQESPSSIVTTLKTGPSSFRPDVRPEAKLRVVLELSSLFRRTVDLQTVLNKTLECLFRLFPQADLGVVLLCDPTTKIPSVRAARNGAGEEPTDVSVSRSVIERALQTHEAILSEDVADDTRFRDSASASALEIRSLMCVPLGSFDEEPFGAIQLTTRNLKKVFTQDDLELMISVATQVGLAIENAFLHAEMVSRTEMERDLEVATQIQLGFLPSRTPSLPGYEFSHYYQAAQQVGGDYFDYIPLPDGRVAVAAGDVSGKGVPAALLMARLCSAVRFHLVAQPNIVQALTALNKELLNASLGFRFITLVIAVVKPDSDTVHLVNAGHLPPLVHEPERSYFLAASHSGLPLGISLDAEYQEHTCVLNPGSFLLFYTDGITETENSRDVLYNRDHLQVARPRGNYSADQLVQHVLADVTQFAENIPQRDDRCVVAIHRLPGISRSSTAPASRKKKSS